jgi:hypothetical protein
LTVAPAVEYRLRERRRTAPAHPALSPVSSRTTDTISAIEYQADDRFWYATTNGRLAYREAGAFLPGAGPGPGVIFNDIAFQPAPGNIGLAVGNSNNVWRTTDGGRTWTTLVMPPTINNDDCLSDPEAGPSLWDNGDSVTWADAGTSSSPATGATS